MSSLPVVNNGINYRSLNWFFSPDFWLPSTVCFDTKPLLDWYPFQERSHLPPKQKKVGNHRLKKGRCVRTIIPTENTVWIPLFFFRNTDVTYRYLTCRNGCIYPIHTRKLTNVPKKGTVSIGNTSEPTLDFQGTFVSFRVCNYINLNTYSTRIWRFSSRLFYESLCFVVFCI